MMIKVKRQSRCLDTDAVFGELYLDSELICLTLERLSKLIPAGTYPVSFYFSPHNQVQVPLLTVPGREYIEIHPANYPYQLEGCIAVGTTHNQDSVSNSRFAFALLMSKLRQVSDAGEDVQIEVSG